MGSIPIAEGETELSAPAASVAVNDRLSYQMACTVKAFPRGEGGRAKRGRMRNGGRTNLGIGLIDGTTRQITARIPHQSPPGGGDSYLQRYACPRQALDSKIRCALQHPWGKPFGAAARRINDHLPSYGCRQNLLAFSIRLWYNTSTTNAGFVYR